MRLPPFEYLRPATLEDALEMLAVHGEDARILAGGTDLLVRMKKGLLRPKVLVSLNSLDELSFIREEADTIAATTGHLALTNNPEFQMVFAESMGFPEYI